MKRRPGVELADVWEVLRDRLGLTRAAASVTGMYQRAGERSAQNASSEGLL
ncbi:hypothetical protein QFZ32_002921 [Streptomyces canus]|uniref:Integrase n=1 Tax=Streptomyces canus TaxID=58343 RepID=A0AAW8FD13_9ACTN|nr:hypothetical protein [Streptomyces canus]MDQ0907473.1 hypothetical protein [Streptomyces canus]MDQ1067481.1 hypothetical protein [Streptomyces canus]